MTSSQCLSGDMLCYVLASDTLGWVTWVGFILTLLALSWSISQSAGAKNSADAAKTAVDTLKNHIDATEHSHLNAQLSTLEHVLGAEQYEVARLYYGPIKRSLRKHIEIRKMTQAESRALNRAIDTVRQQIDVGASGGGVKNSTLSSALDAIMKKVSSWEAQQDQQILKEDKK